MNKLQTFIDTFGASELARRLDVTAGTVSHWRSGRFKVSPSRCSTISKLSDGYLTVNDIRPDIFGTPPREVA